MINSVMGNTGVGIGGFSDYDPTSNLYADANNALRKATHT